MTQLLTLGFLVERRTGLDVSEDGIVDVHCFAEYGTGLTPYALINPERAMHFNTFPIGRVE